MNQKAPLRETLFWGFFRKIGWGKGTRGVTKPPESTPLSKPSFPILFLARWPKKWLKGGRLFREHEGQGTVYCVFIFEMTSRRFKTPGSP
jgi:hypothetical protein